MTEAMRAERDEAFAQGMGFCPNHPTKEERIQPRANFYETPKGPAGLTWRCRRCMQGGHTPNGGSSESITKAREIGLYARKLRTYDKVPRQESVARAREWWAQTHSVTEPIAQGELPPVPQEETRPYDDQQPEASTPEFATVTTEEVHQ